MGNNSERENQQKLTITYDGEILEISPVSMSAITEVFRSLQGSETLATAGVDTTAIGEAPGDEISGCLCIRTDHNRTLCLSVLDTVFSLWRAQRWKTA